MLLNSGQPSRSGPRNALVVLILLALTIGLSVAHHEHVLPAWWTAAEVSPEESVGPFPSWINLKKAYKARGDGSSDDTAALQRALDNVGGEASPDVLYLPAGTYNITSTLNLKYKRHLSIIGEDPTSTIIRWYGPNGGTMLLVNGVTESRWARLTWDGMGKAGAGVAHQWDRVSGYAPSNIEHADEVFQNLGKGIIGGRKGGANDAEVTISRTRFVNCGLAGVSVESFNALNYWIWDSQFVNSGRGVTNEFGAGNFMVYRSLFRNSTVADITIGNTGFFSFRHNLSISSERFLSAYNSGQNAAAITLQGNEILDTKDPVAIDIGNLGLITMLDNRIRSKPGASAPAVRLNTWAYGPDLISVGNRFTVHDPIGVSAPNARWWTLDDEVAPEAFDLRLPTPPSTLPNLHRHVFEVPPGAPSNIIQSAIDEAALAIGQRPVVHLAKGTYDIAKTITIPANSDVQVVGDGYGTAVNWNGSHGGVLFKLNGPSKATFRELTLNAGNANAIEIGNPDQPGSRLHLEGVTGGLTTGNNILAENLLNTVIDCQGCQYSHVSGSSIKAIGPGGTGTSRIVLFGSAMGAESVTSDPLYEVTNGGRLLVEDFWYEGPGSRFIYPRDSSTLAFSGGHIAVYPNAPLEAVMDVSGFNGLLTMLGLEYDLSRISRRGIQIGGAGTNASIFLAGLQFDVRDALHRLPPLTGHVSLMNSKMSTPTSGGWHQIPDLGQARTDVFARNMLSQIRAERPMRLTTLARGVTDVRMYRVNIVSARIGIHVPSGRTDQHE